MNIAELYKEQIPLTEWLGRVNHEEAEVLRKEDNDKRLRLDLFSKYTGVQVDEVFHFSGLDFKNKSEEFIKLYEIKKNKQCAFRLVPLNENMPKHRMRGMTLHDAMAWSEDKEYLPEDYRVEIVSVPNRAYFSTIFVINNNGMYGEIITGAHYKLTQGFYEGEERPYSFSYEFDTNGILKEVEMIDEYRDAVEEIIKSLYIGSEEVRNNLSEELESKFANNYLMGYFETVTSDDYGMWFIDYNRLLGDKYLDLKLSNVSNNLDHNDAEQSKTNQLIIKGKVASSGKVIGKVKIINIENLLETNVSESDVLVCKMTTPIFIPLMQKAIAIVTDDGGTLSHAAITARELGKPCIVGTKIATQVLRDGDMVEVDAEAGVVKVIERTKL